MGLIKDGTVSTKMTKVDGLINLMVEEIDNCQKVKRLMTYLTINPLDEIKSSGYDGTIHFQRDLEGTLTKPQTIYTTSDRNKPEDINSKNILSPPELLIPYPYREGAENSTTPLIFVYNVANGFSNIISDTYIQVDILCPAEYIKLTLFGENRLHQLVKHIINLFDNTTLDEVSAEELGNLRLQVVNSGTEYRINNSSNIDVYSFRVKINDVNARTDYTGGIVRS